MPDSPQDCRIQSFEPRHPQKKPSRLAGLFYGAGDEARTRYLHLGKVALYRMSYTRGTRLIIAEDVKMSRTFSVSPDSSYRNRRPKTAIADCRKKPRRVRCVSSEKDLVIFCQGVYLAENTSQAASVEFVRLRRTNYARSRLQKLAEKPEGVFRQAQIAVRRRRLDIWRFYPSETALSPVVPQAGKAE